MENKNEAEIKNLKKTLDLEIFIREKQTVLRRLVNESFHDAPDEPQRTVLTAVYPDVHSQLKFLKTVETWVWIVLVLIWPLGLYFLFKQKKEFDVMKENDVANIKNSEVYLSQCAQIDKDIAEQQAKIDKQYEMDLKEYNEKILPSYNQEFDAWTKEHNSQIVEVKDALDTARNDLLNHYSDNKLLPPVQYRKIEIMQYIYDMISSSDYDIKQAIDMYDRNEQRKLDEAKLREQQEANEHQAMANRLAEEQAYLLQEQNKIANKARKEANAAAIVGAVQRHNTNKYLKNK